MLILKPIFLQKELTWHPAGERGNPPWSLLPVDSLGQSGVESSGIHVIRVDFFFCYSAVIFIHIFPFSWLCESRHWTARCKRPWVRLVRSSFFFRCISSAPLGGSTFFLLWRLLVPPRHIAHLSSILGMCSRFFFFGGSFSWMISTLWFLFHTHMVPPTNIVFCCCFLLLLVLLPRGRTKQVHSSSVWQTLIQAIEKPS